MKKYPSYFKKPNFFQPEEIKEDNSTSKLTVNSQFYEQGGGLWIPAHILSQQKSYCTKTFCLQNWADEELIQINENCKFVLELDDFPLTQDMKAYIDCELMYFDNNSSGNKSDAQFKCVSVSKSQINLSNILNQPIHEYVPVIFDEEHFNIANITFHSIVSDICGSKKQQDKQIGSNYILDRKISEQRNNEQQGQVTYKYLKEIEKFYSYYVQGLRKSYESFQEFYNQVLADYVLDKQKKDMNSLWDYIPENLPPQEFLTLQNQNNQFHFQSLQNTSVQEIVQESKKDIYSKVYPKITEKMYEDSIKAIIKEINEIQRITLTIFDNFIEFFRYGGSYLCRKLLKQYTKNVKLRYSEFIHSEIFIKDSLAFYCDKKLSDSHISKSIEQRKIPQKNQKYQNVLKVQDTRMFPDIKTMPLIYEEVYVKQSVSHRPSLNCQNNKFHMFVFVHGFQGNAFDMRVLKNHISVLYPEALLLLSVENEGKTEDDIFQLGQNLANEIQNFIFKWSPGSTLGRISFVCHSLGGVIARAALPYLNEYSDKMFTFISLAVPHLGYSQSDKTLVNLGMSVLKIWKKSVALKQLLMSDQKDLRTSFIYNLSQQPGLGWFQNLVLLNSEQDNYVPYESARIEKIPTKNDPVILIYNEMVDNIFKDSQSTKINKLDINFESEEKGIDTFIGRKAHIQFLDQSPLARQLLYNFDYFFK